MASLMLRRLIYRAAASAARSSCVRRISSTSSSAAVQAHAPWLMIGDSFDEEGEFNKLVYNFYNVGDKQVISVDKKRGKDGVVVGSSNGWLALYKLGRDLYRWRCSGIYGFEMFLYNPLSHRSVNLPSIQTPYVSSDTYGPISRDQIRLPNKVIVSSSPKYDEEEECVAIMSFSPYHRLAYCSPGRSFCWTPLCSFDNPVFYEDFVYSTTRKQLFCTTKCDNFESWDFQDPRSPRLNWKMVASDDVDYDPDNYPLSPLLKQEYALKKDFCWSVKYLVFAELSDRLFLVRRHLMEKITSYNALRHPPYQTIGFDVHELITVDPGAKKRGKLIYMDGKLDGMAFFIGSTAHGFVIEDKDKMMENVKPNSIYFTDRKELTSEPYDDYNKPTRTLCGGHDLGIFNYENKTFSSCYYPCDPGNIRRIEPTPTWFMPSPPS